VAGVAGINGVAWDAVELPSQFLENWCWEREALAFISGHVETGEPLPDGLLDKLLAARNFQSAWRWCASWSSRCSTSACTWSGAPAADSVQELLDEVRAGWRWCRRPPFNRFQHGFSHIFAGGYAAGYYSYKWAEVLSSDAFSRFEEEGVFNRPDRPRFLHEILEQGGAREPMELFKQFRGREPSIDALLRHSGIAA
jgi:oligopeptidase A